MISLNQDKLQFDITGVLSSEINQLKNIKITTRYRVELVL